MGVNFPDEIAVDFNFIGSFSINTVVMHDCSLIQIICEFILNCSSICLQQMQVEQETVIGMSQYGNYTNNI